MGALGTASIPAFIGIIKAILAPLLTIYQDAGGVGKQRALLGVLNRLLESGIALYGSWSSREPYPESENALNAFKDRLYEVYSRALMGSGKDETSLRLVAIQGLVHMTELRNFLTNDEIGMIVQYFNDILLDEDCQSQDELKNETIEGLSRVGKLRSNLIMDITFPAFLARLPDRDEDIPRSRYLSSLEVLARVSVEEHIVEVLLRRLLNRLDVLIQNNATAEYVCSILSTLLFVLSRRQLENDQKLDTYLDRLVVGLTRRIIESLDGSSKSLTALNDEAVLGVIGKLACTVGRALPMNGQRKVADNIYSLFTPGYNSLAGYNAPSIERKRTVILSTYLLASVRREVLSMLFPF